MTTATWLRQCDVLIHSGRPSTVGGTQRSNGPFFLVRLKNPGVFRVAPGCSVTEGQRLLRATGASTNAIGSATNVSRESARRWLHGVKLPGAAARAALQRAFSIEPATWDQAPSEHASKPQNGTAGAGAEVVPAPPDGDDDEEDLDDAEDELDLTKPGANREAARLHLIRMQRWRRQAERTGSASERAKMAELERRAIAEYGNFTGERAEPVDEATFTKHPAFREFASKLARLVAGCPSCAPAVRAAVAEVDS